MYQKHSLITCSLFYIMQTKRIVFVSCCIFVFNSVSSEYEILDGDGWGKSLFAFVDYLYPEYTLPSR